MEKSLWEWNGSSENNIFYSYTIFSIQTQWCHAPQRCTPICLFYCFLVSLNSVTAWPPGRLMWSRLYSVASGREVFVLLHSLRMWLLLTSSFLTILFSLSLSLSPSFCCLLRLSAWFRSVLSGDWNEKRRGKFPIEPTRAAFTVKCSLRYSGNAAF